MPVIVGGRGPVRGVPKGVGPAFVLGRIMTVGRGVGLGEAAAVGDAIGDTLGLGLGVGVGVGNPRLVFRFVLVL